MAASIPYKLSLLHSSSKTLGLYHNNASYIVGFPLVKHAKEVQKYVHDGSKIYITDIQYKNMKINRLYISKKININKLSCSLVTIDLSKALLYPIVNNVGIVFALEKMDENEEEFIFDCEYFEPLYNTDVFRSNLL